MENKIYINHKGTIFNPEPIEEIQWSTRLFGAGELKFKVLKDNVMDFKEGDQVTFYRNNVPIFKGISKIKIHIPTATLQPVVY